MPLISLQNVSLSFGGPPLLESINLVIEHGERICLVGRNGTGKSTILRIITGSIKPERGQVVFQQGVRIAELAQEVPKDIAGTVFDVVSGGLGEYGTLLREYHKASSMVSSNQSAQALAELEKIHRRIDAASGWQIQQKVETVISKLSLPADAEFSALSGGLKRRTLLARALAGEPDILLLDEPTNHLDIEAIAWLEEFLLGFRGTVLFVTHDRALIRNVATRILDLDRGQLTSWPGNYETYLECKSAALDAEASENARFDKKLAAEEAWIRQGIKARRTRNEGRVRALKELRRIRGERRDKQGVAVMQIQEAERTGQLVINAENVSFGYNEKTVVCCFSTIILRGDKVGIIGPNGSGKTTLIRLLLRELQPQQGSVKHGTNLRVAYLDQQRAQFDDEKTVMDNIANGSDYVTVDGNRRHVIGYLQDFLFSPERSRSPVKVLSGGERNRLLLAKLFANPSNVLVLDEPTNDLDIETLDLLEELLMNYNGTILLVSHDREFVNNVVTSTLVFEGNGVVREYVGGYDDWVRQRKHETQTRPKQMPRLEKQRDVRKKPRKLSFKEQKELESIPRRIEELEAEQQQIHAFMSNPAFYRENGNKVAAAKARLESIEKELAEAYHRWEELDKIAEKMQSD